MATPPLAPQSPIPDAAVAAGTAPSLSPAESGAAPLLPEAAGPDYGRRFGGVARLYGPAALARFQAAHVCIVGVGGVGSWVAEALARSAVGRLTLVDLDHVAESNMNRQIHALEDTLGQAKVEAMAARIRAINPACRVDWIDDFVTPDNLDELLEPAGPFDLLVDAIDGVRAKTALIAWCRRRGLAVVTAGAAGGQLDPTRLRVDDLSRTIQDPLLSKVRGQLRKFHGFPRDPKKKFNVPAVFSDEPLRYPEPAQSCEAEPRGPAGLSCAGFGSSVCVTASVGLAAASVALKILSQ
ncbi:tRNA threonylcarbamoyladenosine dehydratase [Azospira inquinata]|uniref:tRNA threonylcarbamoyladenosine dehydratase n=1 Tax=Azospira inquinata TaxID=2785627 RepID=A0A975SNS2_9RHOO|nr:tRNA threonylcarbamoyladenosine dehydratase [Azospira inquinata]QWT44900.1 tRNA threonylcarbamoyladenosine dehydratase [Azospira inquinata]QWT49768.1 tRNA threonylcarbamoyladenosine dehydratase [Azospira inquinata]